MKRDAWTSVREERQQQEDKERMSNGSSKKVARKNSRKEANKSYPGDPSNDDIVVWLQRAMFDTLITWIILNGLRICCAFCLCLLPRRVQASLGVKKPLRAKTVVVIGGRFYFRARGLKDTHPVARQGVKRCKGIWRSRARSAGARSRG